MVTEKKTESKYERLRKIGIGSYGVVFKCVNRQSGQIVAIKRYSENDSDPIIRKIAMREVRMLRQLKHPNLINLIEVFRRKRRLHLVFDYCELTVLDVIEKYANNCPLNLIKRIVWQTVNGINYCHSRSCIHRDIKPENILINQSGVVKLCDFGFARNIAVRPILNPSNNSSTAADFVATKRPQLPKRESRALGLESNKENALETTISDYDNQQDSGTNLATDRQALTEYVATRWYRAPELLIGDAYYDYKIDIWAIGCVAAELMRGEPIWPGKTDLDQLCIIKSSLGQLTAKQTHTLLSQAIYDQANIERLLKQTTSIGDSLERKLPARVGQSGIDFVGACLQMDPMRRPSSEELLKHGYIHSIRMTQFMRHEASSAQSSHSTAAAAAAAASTTTLSTSTSTPTTSMILTSNSTSRRLSSTKVSLVAGSKQKPHKTTSMATSTSSTRPPLMGSSEYLPSRRLNSHSLLLAAASQQSPLPQSLALQSTTKRTASKPAPEVKADDVGSAAMQATSLIPQPVSRLVASNAVATADQATRQRQANSYQVRASDDQQQQQQQRAKHNKRKQPINGHANGQRDSVAAQLELASPLHLNASQANKSLLPISRNHHSRPLTLTTNQLQLQQQQQQPRRQPLVSKQQVAEVCSQVTGRRKREQTATGRLVFARKYWRSSFDLDGKDEVGGEGEGNQVEGYEDDHEVRNYEFENNKERDVRTNGGQQKKEPHAVHVKRASVGNNIQLNSADGQLLRANKTSGDEASETLARANKKVLMAESISVHEREAESEGRRICVTDSSASSSNYSSSTQRGFGATLAFNRPTNQISNSTLPQLVREETTATAMKRHHKRQQTLAATN